MTMKINAELGHSINKMQIDKGATKQISLLFLLSFRISVILNDLLFSFEWSRVGPSDTLRMFLLLSSFGSA